MEESDSEPRISVSVTYTFPLPSSPWVGVRVTYPRLEIVWHLLASGPVDTGILKVLQENGFTPEWDSL